MSKIGNNQKPRNWMKIATAMAFVVFTANTANAAPTWSYSMDSAADRANPEGPGGSAYVFGVSGVNGSTRTTHRDDGTWNSSNNNYLRITMKNGSFNPVSGVYINLYGRTGIANPGSYSVGWITRHGPDWFDQISDGQTPKMVYLEVTADGSSRNHSHTPLLSEFETGSKAALELSSAPNTVNRAFEGGIYAFPEDRDPLVYNYKAHIGEWVYYEITHIHGSKLTLSVYTQDGSVAHRDLVSSVSMADGGDELLSFHIANYLEFSVTGTADSYIDLADLYVGDSFMGPPPGFVTGVPRTPPPNPPSQIQ